MSELNFCGYLTSQFYPTCEICKNFIKQKIHVLQYFTDDAVTGNRSNIPASAGKVHWHVMVEDPVASLLK